MAGGNNVIHGAGSVLLRAGLSRAAVAGILGNALQESSWNPGAVGSGGGGLWGFTAHPQSLADLQGFAAQHGANWRNPAVQAQFLLNHLGPGDRHALNSQPNARAAAIWFMNNWERPYVPTENASRRVQGAVQAFRMLSGTNTPLGMPPGRGGVTRVTRGGTTTVRLPGTSVPVTSEHFNQQGYQQAQAKAIAGQYIAQSEQSNPWNAASPQIKGLSTALGNTQTTNALFQTGQLRLSTPNPLNYLQARTTLQKIAGGKEIIRNHPTVSFAFAGDAQKAGYVNPLPGANWERTDMGVDASMKPGAPIRAIGDSRVVHIYPNWYQGQPYVLFQLLSGPMKGRYYYIAEAINPRVRPGQTVRAGQTVGTYNAGGTGLELGWGTSGWQTLAQATGKTGTGDHGNAPAGAAFRRFLNQIGAHAG